MLNYFGERRYFQRGALGCKVRSVWKIVNRKSRGACRRKLSLRIHITTRIFNDGLSNCSQRIIMYRRKCVWQFQLTNLLFQRNEKCFIRDDTNEKKEKKQCFFLLKKYKRDCDPCESQFLCDNTFAIASANSAFK